jgi:hypothetical protein
MSTRKALQLLPPCATTGIGSLPHSQGELALQMALQQSVAYLPQLPHENPGELMIPAALDGLPGLKFDAEGVCTVDQDAWQQGRDRLTQALDQAFAGGDFALFEPSVQACRSWRPFLFELAARKPTFAKVQIAGPTTVRWVTRTSAGAPTSVAPELDQQIHRLVVAKGLAMVKALRALNVTPILFFDEPGLYALERGNVQHLVALKELQLAVVAAQREGALVGLHCCSNTDWPRILEIGLDLVSLDVRLSLDALLEDRDAWLRYLATGATLSLGIVPTDLASTWVLSELCDSVEASLRATLPPELPFEPVLARMLLTPACGLGLRSVIDAERITEQVHEAQRRLVALLG